MSESFLPLLFLVHHTYCDAEANQLASEKSRNDCVRFLFGANKTFSSASGFKKDGHARARHQHKPENAGNSGLEVGNTLKCSNCLPRGQREPGGEIQATSYSEICTSE